MAPAIGMHATARDVGKLMLLLLGKGMFKKKRMLREDTMDRYADVNSSRFSYASYAFTFYSCVDAATGVWFSSIIVLANRYMRCHIYDSEN